MDDRGPLDRPFLVFVIIVTIAVLALGAVLLLLGAFWERARAALLRPLAPIIPLHRLPPTLKTEHFSWTGGNRDADIEHRLRRVWFEDMQQVGTKSRVRWPV